MAHGCRIGLLLRGDVQGVAVVGHLPERLLLDEGQNVVEGAARLIGTETTERIADPNAVPPAGWIVFLHYFMLKEPQPELLEIVLALRLRAASRAACTDGSSSAIKMPMIVMTTRSSTNVNAVGL